MAKATKKQSALVKKWLKRLDKEVEAHRDYRKQGKDADNAARDEINGKTHTFNIFWGNCKILRSATYAKAPKPDVRRRFTQPDPEEKELARLVERSLEYSIDTGEFDIPSKAVVKDFIQTAMGVPRIIYDVTVEDIPDEIDQETMLLAAHMGEELEPTFEQGLQEITSQAVGIEHIPWKHFHWEPGHHQWKNVGWCAIEIFSTPKQIKEDYGVDVSANTDEAKDKRKGAKYADEVQMFEIFDKKSKSILLIAQGYDQPIEVREDKLELQGFYPFPRPAWDNLKTDELIPKPDYCFIQPQIEELNRLSQRRANLVKSIRAVRVYDAAFGDVLDSLENAGDAVNIPVENLTERLEGSTGLDRVIAELPMTDRMATIREIDAQIESVKQEIYEVSGISDIIRGSTHASETAAAQNLKGQWANVRLNDKTDEINRVWRDVLRMMAEVICEHFEPEQLTLMTGIDVTPRMQELMTQDIARQYAIDVETDSTILKDDMDERQQKLDLVNMLLEKLAYVLPMVQQGVIPVEMVQEVMLFIISSHKHGKQLEDTVQGLGESMGNLQNLQQVQQQLQQAQGQLQQAQQQLGQVNEREEARKDAESEARAAKDNAQAIEAELKILEDDDLDDAEQAANIDKTDAETGKIIKETNLLSVPTGQF